MADSSRTIMTDAGFALETRVRADETKMQFTRAAISTDDHFSDTDDALAKLTELYNIQQDGKVTAVQVINTTTVYVQVDVNQAESKADYQMRSAALYAKDDDGTEVLYGVTVLQDPVFVHKDADGSYLGFGINTTVGKASNVVVVVDPANMVTQQVFEGTMKNYYTKAEVDAKFVTDDDFASKLPKNIATTDAANTFVKSQTLAGGATDGKGNAYATTKDVATGLNNGLSTKVTDNKNGTVEVNGSSITPADDSKVLHSTVTQLNSTDMNTVLTAGFYRLVSGTNQMPNEDEWAIYQVIPLASTNGVQLAYGTNNAISGLRSWHTSWINGKSVITFSSWVQFADDSKVVHNSDMRTPASDVAGIEEVNAKQDKIGYTPADDSTVLHNNSLNRITTDDSGIIIGNEQNFGIINRSGGPAGIAIGSGKNFRFMATNDAILSNNSSYHDVWNIAPTGQISILSGAYFTPADDSKVVHDNGDGTVTVDGRKFVPADTDHTIPVSEAGVAGPANFAAGTLKVDDLEVLGAKVLTDSDDYKAFGAAHPGAIIFITHDTDTDTTSTS
ncbi:pyocin knob domain-containing protein [Levilactobacillus brevis]|uniref:pyocin knob domain-containing protein n=1 Tax=Levilactobacillus brevis TaxID=1580 RepID=UPI001CDAE138|nr:pyocin knob domain-containing protein [Levilactobacillus brevis]